MRPGLAVAWLALAAAVPGTSRAAETPSCPIEQVVAEVRQIKGDVRAAHVFRHGQRIEVTPDMCLLYGDRLEAGLQATVVFDTAQGTHHVGDDFNPAWQAPQAELAVAPDVSRILQTLFEGLLTPAHHQSAYATSRGAETCAQSQAAQRPLMPLIRLRDPDQQIGTDLRVLVATWTAWGQPGKVQVELLDENGRTAIEAHGCADGAVGLPLAPGSLRAGTRLYLRITGEDKTSLRYNLVTLDSSQLPQPPFHSRVGWLAAAWRLAAGPPQARLDALSRLWLAAPTALGAQWILNAALRNAPF